MYSPWFIPFQVICAAVLFCGNTVTPTEQRMIEDLRRHWSRMMQRVSADIQCSGAEDLNSPSIDMDATNVLLGT